MLADAILHLNHHQYPVLQPQSIIPESKESISIHSHPVLVREIAVQTDFKIEDESEIKNEDKISPITDVEYAKRVIAKAKDNRMKDTQRKRAYRERLRKQDKGAYLKIQQDYRAKKKRRNNDVP